MVQPSKELINPEKYLVLKSLKQGGYCNHKNLKMKKKIRKRRKKSEILAYYADIAHHKNNPDENRREKSVRYRLGCGSPGRTQGRRSHDLSMDKLSWVLSLIV